MEAKFKCRKCRKSALFNTSTKHFCYDCQRVKSSNSKIWEAKITCRGCRREFSVPSNTSIYCCSVCHTINPCSVSGHGQMQSNKDSGMGMRSIKHGVRNEMTENAYKDAYLLNKQRSSSFSAIGSSFLSRRYNKRAVLCGVTYRKRKFRLKGTVNDVINMKDLLVNVFDFPSEGIRVLTEQEKSPDFIPTKKNILDSLKWLVEGCQPGDSLVFYFSGHGLQHADFKEDEVDGMDESICPVDFMQEGVILDNDMNSILVWPLKKGVTLHAIVDACHSGTILDLTYVYEPQNHKWKNNMPPSKEPIRKHTSGGLAISISACEDTQMAADTTAFAGKGMNGAMTYLFTNILQQNPKTTYKGLIQKMNEEIQEIIRNSCRPSFLRHVFRPKLAQDLIISSSEQFDISKEILL